MGAVSVPINVLIAAYVASQTQVPRNFKARCADWQSEIDAHSSKVNAALSDVRSLLDEAEETYKRVRLLRNREKADAANATRRARANGPVDPEQLSEAEQLAFYERQAGL